MGGIWGICLFCRNLGRPGSLGKPIKSVSGFDGSEDFAKTTGSPGSEGDAPLLACAVKRILVEAARRGRVFRSCSGVLVKLLSLP